MSRNLNDNPQVAASRDAFLRAARTYVHTMNQQAALDSEAWGNHGPALEGFLDGWEHGGRGRGVDQERVKSDEEYAWGAQASVNHLVP